MSSNYKNYKTVIIRALTNSCKFCEILQKDRDSETKTTFYEKWEIVTVYILPMHKKFNLLNIYLYDTVKIDFSIYLNSLPKGRHIENVINNPLDSKFSIL